MFRKFLVVFLFYQFSVVSYAGGVFHLSGIYLSDSQVFSSSTSSSTSFLATSLYISAGLDYGSGGSKDRLLLGATYLTLNQARATSTTEAFASADWLLSARWNFDGNGIFHFGLGYGLVANGVSSSASAMALNGTSYLFKLGVEPKVSGRLSLGITWIYYRSLYTQSVIAGAASDINYSKTLTMPVISLSWKIW
ncbi:MAG: hypothetical protein N2Z70_07185 [Bdellovibrionaceae bacterium]|nr:hypothetical protein [Pseudobdellovibrionaceae bacterium]